MNNLQIFYTKVISDEKFSTEFNNIMTDIEKNGISEEKIHQVISLSNEVGAEISVEDIKNYLDSLDSESEILNETELEMVAGGNHKEMKYDGAEFLRRGYLGTVDATNPQEVRNTMYRLGYTGYMGSTGAHDNIYCNKKGEKVSRYEFWKNFDAENGRTPMEPLEIKD